MGKKFRKQEASPGYQFVMDDPSAVKILAAFYPPTDEITHDQRCAAATKEWLKLYPNSSPTQMSLGINAILNAEHREHARLAAYSKLILWHLAILMEALGFLQRESKDVGQAKANAVEVWKAINSALHSAAAISRIFDVQHSPRATKREIALRKYRSALMRRAVGIHDGGQYMEPVRRARNILEHFEEHLDVRIEAIIENDKAVLDLTCMSASEADATAAELLRWYDPDRLIIHILDEEIAVRSLSDAALEIMMVIPTTVMLRGRYHVQWSFGVRAFEEHKRVAPVPRSKTR